MQIFDSSNSRYSTKVNFVDANNVLVGYDTTQSCCETAGWFLSEKIETAIRQSVIFSDSTLKPYIFDTQTPPLVIKHDNDYQSPSPFWKDLDEGGVVIFRLTAPREPDLYLHLYNSHNGYYSHGFEMRKDDVVLMDSSI